MNVPFVDLKAQYHSIKDEIQQAILQVLESTALVGGPYVAEFEKAFAQYCNTPYAAGVGSGTDALWLALLGLGVGPGDEVITVPNTFIATAEAISLAGARPVLVDIDRETYTMDPMKLEAAITSKTKAIIPVHLFGQMADMDPIVDVARLHGLFVIEDACQAHGAEYKGKRAGSIGDAGCFSFYPSKNLGAYGEGGAVVTHRPELDQKVRMLRDHGQNRKYFHEAVGCNGRLDALQSAVLSVKLRHLEAWNEARMRLAKAYDQGLADLDGEGIVLPKEKPYSRHVYHLYAIRVRNREAVMRSLEKEGISCGIHYPVPIHLQKAYSSLGLQAGTFPVSEAYAKEFISLPMFPELSTEQIQHVVAHVRRAVRD